MPATKQSCAVYTAIHTAYHSIQSLPVNDIIDIEYYDNEDAFLKSQHTFKIAIIEASYAKESETITCAQLEKFKTCDQVLVYSMEGDTHLINVIKKYDLPNFIFIVNCWINFKLTQAKIKHVIPHIVRICQIWAYDFLPLITDNLAPFEKKLYHFDAMYGAPRTHRLYAAKWISNNNLEKYVLQTPFFQGHSTNPNEVNLTYNLNDSNYWEDDVVPSKTNNYLCHYRGVKMSLSHVMPFKLYQQTAFSLVCETTTINEGSFFTEKIAKPLIASRLFIVLSGQYYLKNLRELGFKTFDGIIDESYDLEPDHETRWSMAMEQVKWLCQQDQTQVLEAIRPIVQHNRDLISALHLPTVDINCALESVLMAKYPDLIAVNH